MLVEPPQRFFALTQPEVDQCEARRRNVLIDRARCELRHYPARAASLKIQGVKTRQRISNAKRNPFPAVFTNFLHFDDHLPTGSP